MIELCYGSEHFKLALEQRQTSAEQHYMCQLLYRLSRDNLKHFYLPNLSHHFKLLSYIFVPCPRSYLAYATLISTFYYYCMMYVPSVTLPEIQNVAIFEFFLHDWCCHQSASLTPIIGLYFCSHTLSMPVLSAVFGFLLWNSIARYSVIYEHFCNKYIHNVKVKVGFFYSATYAAMPRPAVLYNRRKWQLIGKS